MCKYCEERIVGPVWEPIHHKNISVGRAGVFLSPLPALYVRMCVCVWFLWDRISSAWSLPCRCGWLASGYQKPPVSAFPALRLHAPRLLFLFSELRFWGWNSNSHTCKARALLALMRVETEMQVDLLPRGPSEPNASSAEVKKSGRDT